MAIALVHSKPWRRCLSWAEHTRHSCCPKRMSTCCCQSPQANMKPGLCPAGGSWKGTDTPKSFHYFLNSFSCNTKIPPVLTAGDIYCCAPTWRYMGKSYYPSANLMSQVLMCHLSTYSCHIYMKMCNYLFVCCCFIFFHFLFWNIYLQCLNFAPFWKWFLFILSIFVSSVVQVRQYKLNHSCTRCLLQLDNIQLNRSFNKAVQICSYVFLSLISDWLS